MVSTPTFDPADGSPDSEDGYYFNNFLDGQITPGSTFKLVTAAAAIDNIANIDSYVFDCDGENEYNGVDFTDIRTHGEVSFRSALAQSCNGAFGELAREVGAKTMKEYTEKAGLTEPVDMNGFKTAAGSFDFPSDDNVKLSWAGIGQADDLVNPCAMMVYMGAIANGGEAIQPTLIKSATFIKEITGGKSLGRYLESDTAEELRSMMKNNVVENYGEENFDGIDIYAKSGTAETGDYNPDAWFVGFTDDESAPYAFVVWVKGGGYGSEVAAPIARTVIRTLEADAAE
jgi:peptidoglycan glycosyltransferase